MRGCGRVGLLMGQGLGGVRSGVAEMLKGFLANFLGRSVYVLRCCCIAFLVLGVGLLPNSISSTELDIGVC
jgi:hypothetical protein